MKTAFHFLLLALLACGSLLAQDPRMKLAEDGFPTGHETPEGAACDIERAFIKNDVGGMYAACLLPFGDGKMRRLYEDSLNGVAEEMKKAAQGEPSPNAPAQIGKVYEARPFSSSIAAAYARQTYGFLDVKFVDIGIYLHSGRMELTRTMVVQTKRGLWMVNPRPDLTPQMSYGLDAEGKSTKDFTQANPIDAP